MRKIVSCVLCDEYRRSPQSKLSGVETFDQDHRAAALGTSPERPWRGGGFLDRKSTRLNSSHLGISYAVFCLKNIQGTSPHSGVARSPTYHARLHRTVLVF